MADLLALADGLPRSLPFQAVNVLFGHADFGKAHDFPIGLTPPTGISRILAFVRPPRGATSPLGAPLVSPPQAEDVRGRLEADLAAAREVTLTTLRN